MTLLELRTKLKELGSIELQHRDGRVLLVVRIDDIEENIVVSDDELFFTMAFRELDFYEVYEGV